MTNICLGNIDVWHVCHGLGASAWVLCVFADPRHMRKSYLRQLSVKRLFMCLFIYIFLQKLNYLLENLTNYKIFNFIQFLIDLLYYNIFCCFLKVYFLKDKNTKYLITAILNNVILTLLLLKICPGVAYLYAV